MKVRFDVSGGNSFQHNTLLQYAHYNIEHNADYYKKFRRRGIKLGRILLGFLSFCVSAAVYQENYIYAIAFLAFFLLNLFTDIHFRRKEKLAKKLQSNVSYNNKVEDIRDAYDEILKTYDLQARESFGEVIKNSQTE